MTRTARMLELSNDFRWLIDVKGWALRVTVSHFDNAKQRQNQSPGLGLADVVEIQTS